MSNRRRKPCYTFFNCGYQNFVRADLVVMLEDVSKKVRGKLPPIIRYSDASIDLTKGRGVLTVIHLEGGRKILSALTLGLLVNINREVVEVWRQSSLSRQLGSEAIGGVPSKSSTDTAEASS